MAAIEPVDVKLPGVRSAMKLARHWSEKNDPEAKERSATRHFLSSREADNRPKQLAEAARTHWSVENKNHYKRDTCGWAEDDHRHRRPKAAQNLALMRNALLAIIPFEEGEPLADYFERYHRSPSQALQLIMKAPPHF